MLARAGEGRSDALLLRGEAGIGKSALCAYAVDQAKGMTVLEARGAPTEQELAYSGLSDVLQPVLTELREIPEQPAAALASALAIGPPLEGGPFATCAATLSVLAAAAEKKPVLAFIFRGTQLISDAGERTGETTRLFMQFPEVRLPHRGPLIHLVYDELRVHVNADSFDPVIARELQSLDQRLNSATL